MKTKEQFRFTLIDTSKQFCIYARDCGEYLTVYSDQNKEELIATACQRKSGQWEFKWKIEIEPEFYRERVENRILGFMENPPTSTK